MSQHAVLRDGHEDITWTNGSSCLDPWPFHLSTDCSIKTFFELLQRAGLNHFVCLSSFSSGEAKQRCGGPCTTAFAAGKTAGSPVEWRALSTVAGCCWSPLPPQSPRIDNVCLCVLSSSLMIPTNSEQISDTIWAIPRTYEILQIVIMSKPFQAYLATERAILSSQSLQVSLRSYRPCHYAQNLHTERSPRVAIWIWQQYGRQWCRPYGSICILSILVVVAQPSWRSSARFDNVPASHLSETAVKRHLRWKMWRENCWHRPKWREGPWWFRAWA